MNEPTPLVWNAHVPLACGRSDVRIRADIIVHVEGLSAQEYREWSAQQMHTDLTLHAQHPQLQACAYHVPLQITGEETSDYEHDSEVSDSDYECHHTPPRRAVVSLESTARDAEQLFRYAVIALDRIAHNQVEGISPLYHVSHTQGQDSMSAVVQMSTTLAPRELVAAVIRVQQELHDAVDIDVIDMEGVESNEPDCMLPWRSARTRAAVLSPWLDMDADAVLAGDPVSYLLALAPDAASVGMIYDNWIIGATS